MKDRPAAMDLLYLAAKALTEEIMPGLPEDKRYAARMVANAMAIAAREMADSGDPARAERDALADLYQEATPAEGDDTELLGEALTRLNWWLVAEIRSGRRDGDGHVHAVLRESARSRLKIVNPKALDSTGDSSR